MLQCDKGHGVYAEGRHTQVPVCCCCRVNKKIGNLLYLLLQQAVVDILVVVAALLFVLNCYASEANKTDHSFILVI